ncbi:uncharacterized protein C2orf72 homolog isoform X2 [Protopterus annectens]|uniref:uncharacterized protein C2orf72 homolog isoform X2 n=1 Tax=Protopterus annectens TaxID=7888 RepID=UPI001CFB78A9|nr:uncharacterized protein C2orf72 homolog isoform X2 [Protopterus annectens]
MNKSVEKLQLVETEFQALLSGIGGKENVLLIGELWEKQPSKELLFCLINKVFSNSKHPDTDSIPDDHRKQNKYTKESYSSKLGCRKTDESCTKDDVSETQQLATAGGMEECNGTPILLCSPGYETNARQTTCKQRADIIRSQTTRDITSPLIVFIFRQDSIISLRRADQSRIKAILKDVRQRICSGTQPALVGVVVPSVAKVEGSVNEETAQRRLDTLLRAVFRRVDSRTVQVTCFIPGQPETEVQTKECVARAARAYMQEANAIQKNSNTTRIWCFPWVKRKKKSHCNQPERAAEDTEEAICLRRQSLDEFRTGEIGQGINKLRD